MIEQVKLAGREWPVPVLAIKQNRIVVPTILAIMPMFVSVMTAISAKETDSTWFTGIKVTTEDFDLMCDAVYTAIAKGTPGLARNEFDNLEITIEELFGALPAVARQTGLLKQAIAGSSQTGEAAAGTTQSTSTQSSAVIAPVPENNGQTS